jgi:hypothetical protein
MSVVINGDGTLTGLTAGGLGVGTVTNDNLATGIESIKLTGALPALDASALTNIASPSAVDASILFGTLPSIDAGQLFNVPSPSSVDANILFGNLPSLDAGQLFNVPAPSSIDANNLYGQLNFGVTVDTASLVGTIETDIDWGYTPQNTIPANRLQGPMPAIDGSALTNLPGSGVTFVENNGTFALGVGTNAKIGSGLYWNTVFGYNAGSNTGSGRTAVGANALANDVGGENTAVGNNAGGAMNTGYSSSTTLIGAGAGRFGQHEQNTYIGGAAGNNANSAYNVGVGFAAGYNLTVGLSNVMIGNNAYENGQGSNNVLVGRDAGKNLVADQCTYVGYSAGEGLGVPNQNQTCLGYNSQPNGGVGEITLGDANISTLRCNTQTISSLSDLRDKTNISDLSYGLDFINKTRPVEFKWESRNGHARDGKVSNGFIAQELLAIGNNEQHNLVAEDNPERLEAAYAALVPMMVKAIQELSAKVKELENK